MLLWRNEEVGQVVWTYPSPGRLALGEDGQALRAPTQEREIIALDLTDGSERRRTPVFD